MAASSRISANTESKYKMASGVEVSKFVSVKLDAGSRYYKIWKAQMLNLVEIWELGCIINAEHPSGADESVIEDDLISKFDKLVKHWILGTLASDLARHVGGPGKAREVWMNLESLYNRPTTDTEEGDPAQKQDDEYMHAFQITVSEFVSVKISGRSNYHIWKTQMLHLIESEKLLHIIIAEYPFPENKGVHMISKYDKLVKAWIFNTMDDKVLEDFIGYSSVQSIWRELEFRFNQPISNSQEGDPVDASALREDLKYIQVLTVKVTNFVLVKLSGPNNYPIWRTQMMYLLNSQELLHIIKAEAPVLEQIHGHLTKKYCSLVLGWILGTMNDRLLNTFKTYTSVQKLWSKLETKFRSSESESDTTEDAKEFTFKKELFKDIPELEISTEDLYKAAVEGSWWKAKSILKVDKSAATRAITQSGNTILHLAVERGHYNFVENLLDFLKDAEDILIQNCKGQTALHIAVIVNNLHMAQLLVQKGKELLKIRDFHHMLPFDYADIHRKFNISTFLLRYMIRDTDFSFDESYVTHVIQTAVYTKQYDLARIWLEVHHISSNRMESILMAITVTFPTDLGLMESLIYPSYNNFHWKILLRDSLLFHCISVVDMLPVMKIRNNTCHIWSEKVFMILLVPIATLDQINHVICLLFRALGLTFSMLYFHLWKILAAIGM